ncbi:uncharacterized protein [Epargyreus clarus]|uniref:uncharacterized protein isoform X2 n=1 Tax=Epargyreus clarus TaxID=520877 RepID=UPI003C301AE8
MPKINLYLYIKIVAAIFATSAVTAFVFAVLRLLKPELYYLDELDGRNLIIHYVICGMMIVTTTIGFINSCVVMSRSSTLNSIKFVTIWLLLDSLFETSRVVYVFLSEVVLCGRGQMQTYDLMVSCGQYFLDSFLYCQMILRH